MEKELLPVPTILLEKLFENFSRCTLDPINKNSVLSGLSFNFLDDILDLSTHTFILLFGLSACGLTREYIWFNPNSTEILYINQKTKSFFFNFKSLLALSAYFEYLRDGFLPFYSFSAGIVFRRQNLTSTDVRF